MKTKIIYISGSEIFDMADIRAAFDEVRAALGLRDTILFGVPVDMDNAIPTQDTVPHAAAQAACNVTAPDMADSASDVTEVEEIQITVPDISQIPAAEIPDALGIPAEDATEPQIDTEVIAPIDATEDAPAAVEPVKKSRGRPRKTVTEATATVAAPEAAPVTEPVAEKTEAKVIPILSILAAKKAEEAAAAAEEEIENPAPEVEELTDDDDTDIVALDEIDEDVATEEEPEDGTDSEPEMDGGDAVVNAAMEIEEHIEIDEVTEVSIDNQIDEDVPADDEEKTLEQLLESMAPLREDRIEQAADAEEIIVPTINDTDATLTQLAEEFAENQDKITPPAQSETHGKIGKLKNILPFKKARRDDNGLMGDLFGWAGIAANDDEFAMPGFFTSAASKK